jgi:hypothetical protein
MMKIAHRYSLPRQLVWAATLATGFGTLWFVLILWLTTSMSEIVQTGAPLHQESLVVRSDGVPLIRSMPLDNLSLTTYRNLKGQPQDVPADRALMTAVYMVGEHEKPGFFSLPPGWEHRLSTFLDEQEPTVHWFFVHDGKPEGAGYFVGYERTSNRRVGFIGLSGFRSTPIPADQQIPVRGALIMDYAQWSSAPSWLYRGRVQVPQVGPTDLPPRLVYVPSGNLLRQVDLAARTVTTVLETPELIESPGIATLPSLLNGQPMKEQRILVRTTQRIYALDHTHRVVRVFAIPTEVDPQSAVNWYEVGKGEAIAAFDRPRSAANADNITNLITYRIAADGAIQDRFDLALQTGSPATNPAVVQMQAFLGLPSPVFLFVVQPFFLTKVDRIQSYSSAVLVRFTALWPSLIAATGLASILAIITWRRSRSFGVPKREQIAWVVFILLLGLPAFVGFLLHRRWPTRQPCPTCHARAPRDRVACAECGTRFPDPSLRGTEVFA